MKVELLMRVYGNELIRGVVCVKGVYSKFNLKVF